MALLKLYLLQAMKFKFTQPTQVRAYTLTIVNVREKMLVEKGNNYKNHEIFIIF
jgi:hypothetical protein